MSNTNDADKTPPKDEQDSSTPATSTPAKSTGSSALNLLSLLLILSASANTSQALVSPLFGHDLASTWFRVGCFIAISLFSLVLPESEKSHSSALKSVVLLQIFGTALSRTLGVYITDALDDPISSALVVHSVIGFPIVGLGGAVWLNWMRVYSAQEEATRAGELIVKAFSCFALSTCIWFIENILGMAVSYLPAVHPKFIMATLAFLTLIIQVSTQPKAPGSKASSSFTSPTLGTIVTLSLLAASVASTFPPNPSPLVNVLSSRFGGQGFVQVVDFQQTSTSSVRYLRKGAAIIGGSYLAPTLDKTGDVLKVDVGETMERKALLLDGVRLVKGIRGKNVLAIGAGTGAITSQLVSHGYNTTLIESDPEVLSAAREFFNMREPAAVHVDDAAGWVERNTHVPEGAEIPYKFDIIVHDTMIGGVANARLYTMEFWENLKNILDQNGVLAVAYSGRPTSTTPRSILNMLLNNFSICRIYHTSALDAAPFSPSAAGNITDFIAFCTSSSSLKFRSPGYADYAFAGHQTRDRLLRTFAQREVLVANILGETPRDRLLLRVTDPRLGQWGKDDAVIAWKAAREAHPSEVWSTY